MVEVKPSLGGIAPPPREFYTHTWPQQHALISYHVQGPQLFGGGGLAYLWSGIRVPYPRTPARCPWWAIGKYSHNAILDDHGRPAANRNRLRLGPQLRHDAGTSWMAAGRHGGRGAVYRAGTRLERFPRPDLDSVDDAGSCIRPSLFSLQPPTLGGITLLTRDGRGNWGAEDDKPQCRH